MPTQKFVDKKNNFHKYNGIFESGKFLCTYSKIRLQVYFLKLFNFTRLRPKDQISSRHQGTLTNRKKEAQIAICFVMELVMHLLRQFTAHISNI